MPDKTHALPTFFFTARAAHRGSPVFLDNIHSLRAAMRSVRERYPFEIDEIVVLGDTIHTLWTLPEGQSDCASRWRMLKRAVSSLVSAQAGGSVSGPIWSRALWEHRIRDAGDLAMHRHMIWHAPVEAGLVQRPQDWPHSSIHRAIGNGTYAPMPRIARTVEIGVPA